MTDDELLALAGEALREPDVLDDERWDQLAAGQLDGDDRAELEALAQESELAADALVAFAPLSDDVTGRLEDLFPPEEALVADEEPVADEAPAPAPATNVFSLDQARARRRRWMMGSASAVAIAAVAFFTLRPGTGGPPISDMVEYRLEVDGGQKAFRSSDAADLEERVLSPESAVRLTVVPAHRMEQPVAAQAWFVRDADVSPLDLPWQINASGVVDVSATAAVLFGERRGRGALIIAVRPASSPAASSPGDASAAGYRTLRQWFELTD